MGVATAVASALGRAREFKKLLFREHRSMRETVLLVLFMCVPFALGVYIRFSVKTFMAADLGFGASILIGVVGGPVSGTMGSPLAALPALFHGQFPTRPVKMIAVPLTL